MSTFKKKLQNKTTLPKPFPIPRTKVARLALAVSIFLVLGGLAVGATGLLKPAQELERVTITLRAEGFDPEETTLQAGRFLLAIDNQSGDETLVLRINRDGSRELVQQTTLPTGAQAWSVEVDLPAGGYMLSEDNHPAWLFHITAQ